jgi:hypothetical protein
MSETWRVSGNDVPICPHCQNDLSFVGSWTYRGRWGYNEVRTYECPAHGPIFIGPETSLGVGREKATDKPPDYGDRDSLISARRKPTPTLDADAIALPEPESD